MADDEIPVFRLLQPEIMTNDELVSVLKRYKLSTTLSSTSRDELIEIYKRIALPLPQRTNGTTWRERLLAKKRNRKRISLDKNAARIVNTSQSSSTDNSSPRPALSVRRNRLKPPVIVASEKKVIRLSTSSNNGSPASSKIAIDADGSSTEEKNGSVTPQAGKHKRIRIDFSDSAEKSTPVPKVVRRLSEEKVSSQPVSKHRRIVI